MEIPSRTLSDENLWRLGFVFGKRFLLWKVEPNCLSIVDKSSETVDKSCELVDKYHFLVEKSRNMVDKL